MEILIDTSVLIDHIRKTKKKDTLFSKIILFHKPLISEIVAFELLIGKNKTNQYFINGILENIEHLPFDNACKFKAVEIYLNLRKNNKLIQPPDIFIAATALAHNYPLATFNIKHFNRVKNLKIITDKNI